MRRDGFLDAVGDYVKPAGALASSVVAIAAFAANGCPDTSGDGNNFRLEGRVETVGDRSLTLEVGRILVARGRAQDTFHADKTIQVHR